jgi:hypothetical protein
VRQRVIVWVGSSLLAGASVTVNACGANPHATFDKFIGAFNALDWDTFRSCLADSASLFNPDIPGAISLHRLDGRTDVERSFRAVFDAAANGPPPRGPNIHPEHVSFQQFSNTALVTFEFPRSGGSFGRRSLFLIREHGSWKILHIHASNVVLRPGDAE